MKSKKAQSSLEFLILVGFLFFAFTVFFIMIRENLSDKLDEKLNVEIKDLAYSVKNEIELAFQSGEGYRREFNIPLDLDGRGYEIDISEDILSVRTSDGEHAISISVKQTSGQIQKSANIIKKENGEVKLNS